MKVQDQSLPGLQPSRPQRCGAREGSRKEQRLGAREKRPSSPSGLPCPCKGLRRLHSSQTLSWCLQPAGLWASATSRQRSLRGARGSGTHGGRTGRRSPGSRHSGVKRDAHVLGDGGGETPAPGRGPGRPATQKERHGPGSRCGRLGTRRWEGKGREGASSAWEAPGIYPPPGPAGESVFSCCFQEVMSEWTRLISCRPFYWGGNAAAPLRGPRCRETLAWGGPRRGTTRTSRRSA